MSDYSVDILYNSDFGSQGLGLGELNYPSGLCILNNKIYIADKQNHRVFIYNINGFFDWFLPSLDLLSAIYTNLHLEGVGGFSGQNYECSTEPNATNQWILNFATGSLTQGAKADSYRVRACRSFVDTVTVYSLRDTGPAGGLICYVDGTTYYETAPSDQSAAQAWSNINNVLIGTTGTAIGTGAANTAAIIAQVGHTDSAALLTDEYDNTYDSFGTVGSGNDNFFFPEDITTDGTDLYITDSANHRIKKHQIDGAFISEFGTTGTGNDNFKYPIGIEYNSGKLYISDKQNHRIKTHLIDGTFVFEFGVFGSGDSNFNFPEGLAIVDNNLIIADSGNKKVKTFTISGVFLSKISDIIFGYPTGIFNVNDFIYGVVDKTRNRLFFFDNTNSFIKEFGSVGAGNNQFYFPMHAKFENNLLYVVDSGNFRVKILDVDAVVDVPIYKDRILKLSKQLYPTGRAFWLNYDNIFSRVNEALAFSESRALQSSVGILDSILPDNDNFDITDAANWESALGLYVNSELSLTDRKAAILRKMRHPGNVLARQHYLYLQGQLQLAGFNVYVHENRNPIGGGNYEVINTIPSIHGEFNFGGNVHGNIGISNYTKLANYVDELKDENFIFGGSVSLRATFFIGGETFGTRADVDILRKNEFRQLILTIKPAQTAGFLLIDYI